jgi:uncharacterized protein
MSKNGQTLLRYASIGVGYGGYLQIGAWLANHLTEVLDDLTFWIDFHVTAKWFRKGEQLLQHGEAELGLFNTRGVASMAMRGNGLYTEPFPSLRAIASFPHHDWLLFAVDQSFGVRTFAELKERKAPLKLTTGFLDGDNVVGWFALELLKRHGIDPDEFRSWGGEILPTGINQTFQLLKAGTANAICQEGVFSKAVRDQFTSRPMFCLPTEARVLQELKDEFGWGSITVPANFYAGQNEPLVAPDFSEWLLCCRADLDEELTYQMARIVVDHGTETAETTLAGTNKRIVVAVPQPPGDPKKAADTTPVPLHPGAERLYRERGLL